MSTVPIVSFGDQKNKMIHCFFVLATVVVIYRAFRVISIKLGWLEQLNREFV